MEHIIIIESILMNHSHRVQKELKKLMIHKNIIFENDMYKYLPNEIVSDNYSIYLILHEIAKKAYINIGTCGYVRLGHKYDYCLTDSLVGKLFHIK